MNKKTEQINILLNQLQKQGFTKSLLIEVMKNNCKTNKEKLQFLQNYGQYKVRGWRELYKSVKIKIDTWKNMQKIRTENNLTKMSDVIDFLLENQKKN